MRALESSLTLDHLWRVAQTLEAKPQVWFRSEMRALQERSSFEVMVPLSEVLWHWEELHRRTRDRLVGARAGQLGLTHQQSPITFLCATAPDLRTSARALSRFIDLASPWLSWRVRETLNHVRLESTVDVQGLGAKLLLEYTLGDMIATSSELLEGWSLSYVQVPYSADVAAELERRWACDVRVGPPGQIAFAFPRALTSRALRRTDAETFSDLHATLDAVWREREPGIAIHHRVAWLLERSAGRVELEQACESLFMSASTLQRRLRSEGWSYQGVRAEWRVRRAHELIADTDWPLDEIAHVLGLSEYRALARLFKRRTGRTPGEARASGDVEVLWDARWRDPYAPSTSPDAVGA